MELSIVIINHNYGDFLRTAIDSALNQNTLAVKIIVVDDGSTDSSREIIECYRGRIDIIFKEAGGHVSAVNAGYAAVNSDLCIFLDADDRLYPHCIETVINVWQPGYVKLQYRLDTIDGEGVDQQMPFPHFPTDLSPEAVRIQSFRFGVYPWTVSSGNAFSRKLLDALLPIDPAEIYRSPDGYLNKMAPLYGDVGSISDVLGAYRVHGANAWAQKADGLSIDPVLRWLKFDRVLHENFEREASKLGIAVARIDDVATLQQMEYRLLAFRFAPGQFEPRGTTGGDLFQIGVHAALIAPNMNTLGRIAWMIWLFITAFFPKFIIGFIFRIGRAQSGRNFFSRLLIGLTRGSSVSREV